MKADKNTFYNIYEKYKYLMFSIAMDILKDQYSAEDAVQEAFVKILKHYKKIDDIESNRTKRMIITITKNCAIDIYRKRSRQWNSETDIENVGHLEDIDNYFTVEDERYKCINELPDTYKEILILKYSSGFSNVEIAEILEVSEVNVRKRISRARKLLKKNMEGRG